MTDSQGRQMQKAGGFDESLKKKFKSSTTPVNSQLVCIRPVGILNPIMFHLN